MELKIESMENMKKVVAKCLDDLMKKSDLTPVETKAALDGFKLHDELCCRIEDCKNQEEDMTDGYQERRYSGGYSGDHVPHRMYHMTSYGLPERAHMERSYRGNNHPMPEGMRGYGYESYCGEPEYSERRGYSRHSISDRVVSMVEKMMDTAESDYERQELQKYIRAIRAMGMTD